MVALDAEFKFHPIGQGCFYSGRIDLLNRPELCFDFVYDCGTDSKMKYLENEIGVFTSKLNSYKLDLLMISHFDADHVNGVSTLLKKIHCKRVIIPYYEPIERLLLYATTTSPDDDYRRFLQNPVNFFNDPDRFNVDEIIIVGGPDNLGVAEQFNPENISPIDRMSFEVMEKEIDSIKELPFNAKLEDFNTGNLMVKNIKALEPPATDFSKVKLLTAPHRIDIGIWEFLFYLKEHEDTLLIKKFTGDVIDLLAAKRMTFTDLFEEENIKELKKIYRNHYGENLNATSLVTFHGPLFNAKNHQNFFSPYYRFWCDPARNCGTLLTGDIDLNGKNKLNKMLRYFNACLQEVCVFQVPHHGSIHNWYNKYPNGLEKFCTYVVNHGVGRIHHPSRDVVDYIITHCDGPIRFNNEAASFLYGFQIVN